MRKFLCILISACIVGCSPEQKKTEDADVMPMDHKMGEDELHLSDQQIQLGNIRVEPVVERELHEELLIPGTVRPDPSRAVAAAVRVMGRIDKLNFKNVGDVISRGDVLFEIYSEDLNMAIREALLANEKLKLLRNEQVDMAKIAESARTRLKLFGITDKQIAQWEKDGFDSNTVPIYSVEEGIITSVDVKQGDRVMEGASIYHLADLSQLWVEGQLYSGYLDLVKAGMDAKVTFPAYPGTELKSKISFIEPELKEASPINTIRMEVPNPQQLLKPGMQTYIRITTHTLKALAVPTEAVLRDAMGATVWVRTGPNMYKSKMVSIGLEDSQYTEIVDGLEKGEEVVISGAYLLNSEYIFKKGANPMEGHDMSKM